MFCRHTEPLNVATDLKADEARQFFSGKSFAFMKAFLQAQFVWVFILCYSLSPNNYLCLIYVLEIVGAGLSCTANYVVRNPKGEIVALRWACIMKRNDQANDYTFESSTDNWKIQEIQRFLSTVESKVSLWKLARLIFIFRSGK